MAIIRCETESRNQHQILAAKDKSHRLKDDDLDLKKTYHFLKIDQIVNKCFIALVGECHVCKKQEKENTNFGKDVETVFGKTSNKNTSKFQPRAIEINVRICVVSVVSHLFLQLGLKCKRKVNVFLDKHFGKVWRFKVSVKKVFYACF